MMRDEETEERVARAASDAVFDASLEYDIPSGAMVAALVEGKVRAAVREAEGERLPKIALRRHGDELDDVVVENVTMFRAEMMSEQSLWLCCYLTNGERISFQAHVGGIRPRAPLAFDAIEIPPHEDWDEARRAAAREVEDA